MTIARELAAAESKARGESPCISCPKRPYYLELCGRLEDHVDAPDHGKVFGETAIGVNLRDSTAQREGPAHNASHEQSNAGTIRGLPTEFYMVNESGHRRTVTAEQAERIRQEWSGHFLLDLSRQTLLVRTGKAVKVVQFGSARLHWGVQKILMVGMSQPGVGFGYAKFSKASPHGSGIGDVSALTRYVHDARRAIGDCGRRSRFLHKTRVELSESPTRWGYVFDDRYSYLVIAKCPPGKYADTTKSTGQSRVDQESGQ